MPSVVRDEFGPTLPEIIAARSGRPVARVRRMLFVALAALVLLGAGAKLLQRAAARGEVVVERGGAFAFNLTYDAGRLGRPDARSGERLRLVSPSSPLLEFVVAERELPRYAGDVNGVLPRVAGEVARAMRAQDPAFVLRSEGRARVNENPGYQIVFQTKVAGATVYGRRVFLYDDPDDDEATLNRPTVLADITLRAQRTTSIPKADAVGGNGPLKQPYRSFRFGTERP